MADKEQIMKQMDEAGVQAEVELRQNFKKLTSRDIVIWWMSWYLKAGHKRLGRILVAIGKEEKLTAAKK